jgi:hypothetical protein
MRGGRPGFGFVGCQPEGGLEEDGRPGWAWEDVLCWANSFSNTDGERISGWVSFVDLGALRRERGCLADAAISRSKFDLD